CVLPGAALVGAPVCVRHAWPPRNANEAASNASSQAGATLVSSSPATTGPRIVASQTCAVASELAARRPSSPPTSPSIVYWPALPELARRDDPASSTTYATGESASVAASTTTVPSRPARSRQWARTSVRAGRRRRYLPRASAPTAPGRVYAASAIPTKRPSSPAGAGRTASHAIVAVLIPSPREETPRPRHSRPAPRSFRRAPN